MKKTIFIPFLVLITACNHRSNNKVTHQNEVTESLSVKQKTMNTIVRKDSILRKNLSNQVGKSNSNNLIIGLWAPKEDENAAFEIRKTTFFYPEHSASYKYKILGDSIKIKYDGFDAAFAFKLPTKDILVLTGEDGEHTFYRIK